MRAAGDASCCAYANVSITGGTGCSPFRGERAAAIYSLLGTAQLNGLNIEAYLKLLLDRLPDHPVNRVEELLPWAVAAELPALRLAA